MPNKMAENLHRVNVKFHQEDYDKLKSLAKRLAVPVSAPLRIAVLDLVDEIESGNFKIEQEPRQSTELRMVIANLDKGNHELIQAEAKKYEAPASFLYREAIFRLLRKMKTDKTLNFRIRAANVDNKHGGGHQIAPPSRS